MNLERLSAFVVFSEHCNLTRAARTLCISQPALHAQIARLSEELGVPLYLRLGRTLRLTQEGEQVAAFGRDLIAQVSAFSLRLRGESAAAPVTLAAGEGAFLYLLGPAIQTFSQMKAAPLRLLTTDLDQTVAAIRSGEAQLGVAVLREAPEGLEATLLAAVPPALLLPCGHPLASGDGPVSLSDLQGARLIVPPRGRPHREAIAEALGQAGVDWTVAVEAGGWELMRHFVAMGLGLALVNGFCPPPAGGTRRKVMGLPIRRYVILQRCGARLSAGAAALRGALLAHRDDWRDHA